MISKNSAEKRGTKFIRSDVKDLSQVIKSKVKIEEGRGQILSEHSIM